MKIAGLDTAGVYKARSSKLDFDNKGITLELDQYNRVQAITFYNAQVLAGKRHITQFAGQIPFDVKFDDDFNPRAAPIFNSQAAVQTVQSVKGYMKRAVPVLAGDNMLEFEVAYLSLSNYYEMQKTAAKNLSTSFPLIGMYQLRVLNKQPDVYVVAPFPLCNGITNEMLEVEREKQAVKLHKSLEVNFGYTELNTAEDSRLKGGAHISYRMATRMGDDGGSPFSQYFWLALDSYTYSVDGFDGVPRLALLQINYGLRIFNPKLSRIVSPFIYVMPGFNLARNSDLKVSNATMQATSFHLNFALGGGLQFAPQSRHSLILEAGFKYNNGVKHYRFFEYQSQHFVDYKVSGMKAFHFSLGYTFSFR